MVSFEPHGPFVVPSEKGPPRFIDRVHAAAFWDDDATQALAARRGAYILAVRAGRGITPVYVGKATRSFEQEVLVDRNLQSFNGGLRDWRRARPVVLLLAQPHRRGRSAHRAIAELEDFLIVLCEEQNPRLRNVHGLGGEQPFEIVGVTDGRRGAPSTAASAVRRTIGWADRAHRSMRVSARRRAP